MNRLVSQNLALNSMFMSTPSSETMALINNKNSDKTTELSKAKPEHEETKEIEHKASNASETKEISLESEIRNSLLNENINKTGTSGTATELFSPAFMENKFNKSITAEFGIQVENLSDILTENLHISEIEIKPKTVQKIEFGIQNNDLGKELSYSNICNFNITSVSKIKTTKFTGLNSIAFNLMQISVVSQAKPIAATNISTPQTSPEKPIAPRKKSLSETVAEITKKSKNSTFDPLRSFFVLVFLVLLWEWHV